MARTAAAAPAPAPPWRSFSFFTQADVKDSGDLAASPVAFAAPNAISVIEPASTEGGQILVADLGGGVNVLGEFRGVETLCWEGGELQMLMCDRCLVRANRPFVRRREALDCVRWRTMYASVGG